MTIEDRVVIQNPKSDSSKDESRALRHQALSIIHVHRTKSGVLNLIRESIAEQCEGNSAVSDQEEMATVAPVAPAAAVRLSWGPIGKNLYAMADNCKSAIIEPR